MLLTPAIDSRVISIRTKFGLDTWFEYDELTISSSVRLCSLFGLRHDTLSIVISTFFREMRSCARREILVAGMDCLSRWYEVALIIRDGRLHMRRSRSVIIVRHTSRIVLHSFEVVYAARVGAQLWR